MRQKIVVLLIGDGRAMGVILRKVTGQDGDISILLAKNSGEAHQQCVIHGHVDIAVIMADYDSEPVWSTLIAFSATIAERGTKTYADTGLPNLDERLLKEGGCLEILGNRSVIDHVVSTARAMRQESRESSPTAS